MSQQNVEIVRRAMELLSEAYESGEVTDEILARCAPDLELDASRRVFNPATYHGHAGLRSAVSEIADAWEDFREEKEQLIDVGDRVLALQTIAGRGRASGVEVRAAGALIWTIRDGRVVRVEVFTIRPKPVKPWGSRSRRP
jgi:ketosteroid isomerase-like protein